MPLVYHNNMDNGMKIGIHGVLWHYKAIQRMACGLYP